MSPAPSSRQKDDTPYTDDLRSYLRETLAARCARNKRYSLRAFARQLRIDHSTLSQILRGNRALAVLTIERLCERLAVPHDICERFVVAERSRRRQSVEQMHSIERLGRDISILLSDWKHLAILELTRVESFSPDSRWIARVLGCTVDDVNVAVQRLLRFRLLSMPESGRWTAHSPAVALGLDGLLAAVSSCLPAYRSGEGSPDSKGTWDVRPRDRAETTIAIDSRRVNEAAEIMERCRREVTQLLTASASKDDVYQLVISLTPVTTGKP